MRRAPLILLAAAAALVLCPRTPGVLRPPSLRPPAGLRDALGGEWPDLATLHERAGLPGDRCAWCHLEMSPRAARALADDPARWIASAGPAAAATPVVTSTVCLSCHDGTVARPGPNLDGTPGDPALGGGGGHPLGVDYMASYLRAPDEYKPPAANLDVRLEDGKVGCISCHLGHARNGRPGGPGGVTANTCRACHNR